MYKNTYSVKHSLRHLFLQKYERYLPTAFDHSMSLLEKMNKLIEAQNKLVDAMNAHTQHTSETIERAFDIIDTNMDFTLQEFRDELEKQTELYENIRDKIHSDLLPDSVKQVLEEWLLNGTIKDMIQDTVFPDFLERLEQYENRLEEMELLEEVSMTHFYYMAEELPDGTYNWTKALEHALSISDNVVIPEGEYLIDPIDLSPEQSNKNIVGRGDSTRISVNGTDAFTLEGNVEKIRRLTHSMNEGENTFYLDDTSGLNSGDDIIIQSERNCLSHEDAGTDWVLGDGTGNNKQRVPFGEFAIIDEVFSDRITTVKFPIYHHYGSTNDGQIRPVQDYTTIRKVNFIQNVKIKDIRINKINSGFVMRTSYAKNCVLDGATFIDGNETTSSRGICNIRMSYNCEARNSVYESPRDMGFDDSNYWLQNPYKITSCQNTGIVNCQSLNAGQMIDISFVSGGMPNTSCYIKDNRSLNSSRTGFTTHGGNYLTQVTGNHVEGVAQGFNHRGRGGIISGNTFIGTSKVTIGSSLSSGVSLYQHGAVDNVITGNIFRNFANGVSYVDGNGSRAKSIDTIISQNNFDNCNHAVHINRLYTGGSNVETKELNVMISDNFIKMKNNVDNSSVTGIRIMERSNGIVIKGNTFKGIESDGVGFGNPRVNNFRAIEMVGNNDEIRIYDNVFMDVDWAIYHNGTADAYTSGVYPDGVNFYENNNRRIRVRVNDRIHRTVKPVQGDHMESRLHLSSITGSQENQLSYFGTSGKNMRSESSGQVLSLNRGVHEVSWNYGLYGIAGYPDNYVTFRVKVNGSTIMKWEDHTGNQRSVNTKFIANQGDTFEVTIQKSSSDVAVNFNTGVGDNLFSITNITNM